MVDRAAGYAAGIFELARAEGELERVEGELFTVARAVEASNELRDALANPQLPVTRKQAILDDLLGGRASSFTVGLVSFLVAQGRGSELSAIVDEFVARAAASRAKVVAEVRTAVALDEATINRLAEALSRSTGKQVEVKAIVDHSVIGGVVAQVGDTVIDGSVARKFASLRQALLRG